MIGLEFVRSRESREPAGQLVYAIVQECARNGLLVESAAKDGNVIRFLAPLVMTDEQTEAGLHILHDAIAAVTR